MMMDQQPNLLLAYTQRMTLIGRPIQIGALVGLIAKYLPGYDLYEVLLGNGLGVVHLRAAVVHKATLQTPVDQQQRLVADIATSVAPFLEFLQSQQRKPSPVMETLREHLASKRQYQDMHNEQSGRNSERSDSFPTSQVVAPHDQEDVYNQAFKRARLDSLSDMLAFPKATSPASTSSTDFSCAATFSWSATKKDTSQRQQKSSSDPKVAVTRLSCVSSTQDLASPKLTPKSELCPNSGFESTRPSPLNVRADTQGTVVVKEDQESPAGNTKAQVFKKIHSCYKRRSPTSSPKSVESGSSEFGVDGKTSGSTLPLYPEIETALESFVNINAARISTLRTRAIMNQTMAGFEGLLPVSPGVYIVNCITSACPLCGRAIALNKLASCENWCKHLDLHGEIGKQISARFRAIDKNVPSPPCLDVELAKASKWVKVASRPDMAPESESLVSVPKDIIPLSAYFSWPALLFSQLFLEEALLSSSVIGQELVHVGLGALGIPFQASQYTAELVSFQESLHKVSEEAFWKYIGAADASNPVGSHPLALNGFGSQSRHVLSSQVKMHVLQQVFWTGTSLSREGAPQVDYNTLECRIQDQHPSSSLALSACRLLIVRRRQLLVQTLETFATEPMESETKTKKEEEDIDPRTIIINAFLSACPFCDTLVSCKEPMLDCAEWLSHIQNAHASNPAAQSFVSRYEALSQNKVAKNLPSEANELCLLKDHPIRADAAPLSEPEFLFTQARIPLTSRVEWRGLLLDFLLKHGVLTPMSTLTQEIVVMGLFYYGLVNQRSPQKFGQYPQLQQFQIGLYRSSTLAYDLYCGAGIKEGEIGSSHTRGRPVNVTKAVLQHYHHYGLSHKSLKRSNLKLQ